MQSILVSLCFILSSFISLAQMHQSAIANKATPIVLGQQHCISSKALAESRKINIYLPPGYTLSDTAKFPVIYLLDGGIDEDFIHLVGLVQFNSLPWVAQIPESIVVGIENVDRKRDFTFPTATPGEKAKYPTTGGSSKFISFIEKELKPFVGKNYRVNNKSTIIGQSLGGLLATEILFTKPYLFDTYIIISPSLWWNDGSLLRTQLSKASWVIHGDKEVYIGVGKEGLAPSANPHVMEVDANLLKEKIEGTNNKNIRLLFDYLPAENHATITHQAVFNAFRMLYPIPADK